MIVEMEEAAEFLIESLLDTQQAQTSKITYTLNLLRKSGNLDPEVTTRSSEHLQKSWGLL